MDKDSELLNVMIADMEAAPSIYRPGNFWAIFIRDIAREIKKQGISCFRRHKHALGLYVPTYPEGQAGSMEALCDYKVFLAGDVESDPNLTSISESSIGSPTQQFCFDNNQYSRSMLNYLRGLVFLKKKVHTSSIRRVLEIGGGFGTLGEIFLKSDFHRNFYVNIDIPPVSYVATRYLEAVFGREHVAGYDVTRDMTEIDMEAFAEKYRAMVLLPWQLPKLKGEFDLFVNFFSFQEMEPDIVENYASHINRLVKGYLLLRNQRTGKQVAERPGDVGVLEPVTREHYIRFFEPFGVAGIDSRVFGNQKDGFESEVIVFKHKEMERLTEESKDLYEKRRVE